LASLQSYYGQALLFTGDPAGAAVALRKELATDPNDYDANLRLGQILLQRHEFREAQPLFERALRLRPGSPEAGYGLAQLDLAAHKPEKARERLEQVVARWPSSIDAHRALAQAAAEAGYPSEAARERERADQLDRGGLSTGLQTGSQSPDFTLVIPSGERRLQLSDFRGKRPVVLILGSYTCPKFRSQAPTLNSLWLRYHEQSEFLLVYIREAHGSGGWQSSVNQREGVDLPDPASFGEKRGYAASCIRKLKIPYAVVVDPMDDSTEKAFKAWPSRVYLIDKRGVIVCNSLLDEQNFDVAAFELALRSAI
jgi:tetratricopeptide (TPR) repeat protein